RPRRHPHARTRTIERLDFRDDFQSFLSRSGVAGVIQAHHQQRGITLLQGIENSAYRSDGLSLMPLAFEQNPKRFQHIALIIGNKNPAHRLTLNRESVILSMVQPNVLLPKAARSLNQINQETRNSGKV